LNSNFCDPQRSVTAARAALSILPSAARRQGYKDLRCEEQYELLNVLYGDEEVVLKARRCTSNVLRTKARWDFEEISNLGTIAFSGRLAYYDGQLNPQNDYAFQRDALKKFLGNCGRLWPAHFEDIGEWLEYAAKKDPIQLGEIRQKLATKKMGVTAWYRHLYQNLSDVHEFSAKYKLAYQ
jgi:hypothetical protein